jgi:hypothetical protein
LSKEQPIKTLIHKMLDNYKLSGKYNEVNLSQHWEEIVGQMIARSTSKLYIHEKKLVLHLNSAALKNELRFHKKMLVERVNDFVGKDIVNDLVIR